MDYGIVVVTTCIDAVPFFHYDGVQSMTVMEGVSPDSRNRTGYINRPQCITVRKNVCRDCLNIAADIQISKMAAIFKCFSRS